MNMTRKESYDQERTVFVLQGGGALGSYQAGVFQALSDNGHTPDWVSGISIGAVNAALIAGNPAERRIQRLRDFWDLVSSHFTLPPLIPGEQAREFYNKTSAAFTLAFGAPGFFAPRIGAPFSYGSNGTGVLSYYETDQLQDTLERFVDFDLINEGPIRLSVGAVNVETGNFIYFDSDHQTITAEHIMASGALPPGFDAVEIDGGRYWDGGLVSNTPLQYVLDERPRRDMLVFQVDLFSAHGPQPSNLSDVAERQKDISYSSRTRLNTDVFRHTQSIRRATHRLLGKLPDDMKNDPDAMFLRESSCNAAVSIVHLIHKRKTYSSQSKDYEFSRASIDEHWNDGIAAVERTFAHEAWKMREKPKLGVNVYDLASAP